MNCCSSICLLHCTVPENVHTPLQKGLEFPGEIGGDSVRPTLHWEKCGQGLNPGPSIICGLGFLLLFFVLSKVFFLFSALPPITEKQQNTVLS